MRITIIERGVPAAVALVALGALAAWLLAGHGMDVSRRVPGTDRIAGGAEQPTARPLDGVATTLVSTEAAPVLGEWPNYRGPALDFVAADVPPLAREWPASGPPKLWDVALGEGYAAAAVRDSRVYVMDYDREAQQDALRCLALDDGRELWRLAYPLKVKRNHGMSRTIPTVTPNAVVAMGPLCHVICADPLTGAYRWGLDLARDYGVVVPPWYAGQCPLVVDGKVILGLGGDLLAMAVDLASGEVLWTTPNPQAWQMSHASLTPLTFAGRAMVVYCASGGVAGIDVESGELLWSTSEWKISIATVPSPVVVGDGRIFVSGGYNAGSAMLQLTASETGMDAAIAWRLAPTVFGATQQTPVLYDGHLYGIRPNGELVCLDLDGKVRWASGHAYRFGLGPMAIADRLIFAMNDDGTLTIAEARPDAFVPLDQADVLAGHESWGPLTIAGGRLIARDFTQMICLDIQAPEGR